MADAVSVFADAVDLLPVRRRSEQFKTVAQDQRPTVGVKPQPRGQNITALQLGPRRQQPEQVFGQLSGGLLNGSIPAGGQTRDNLRTIFTEDAALVTVNLTGTQLKALLEISVSRIELTEEELIDQERSSFDGFLQVSGFCFLYDASAPGGQRVNEIKLDSGLSVLEDGDEICVTAVIPADMAAGKWGYPQLDGAVETGKTALDCMEQWLASCGTVEMPKDGRIRIRGSSEQSIFAEYLPLAVVIPAMILLAIPQYWIRKQKQEDEF